MRQMVRKIQLKQRTPHLFRKFQSLRTNSGMPKTFTKIEL